MLPAIQHIKLFLKSNRAAFLKKSFLFSLLSAVMLCVAVRLFFCQFPFTINEGADLFTKTLMVIWSFIISCKMLFKMMAVAENYYNKTALRPARLLQDIKLKLHKINLACAIFAGKAHAVSSSTFSDTTSLTKEELMSEPELIF